MTNILVITHLSSINSGLAIYGKNLIENLIERGHKVTEFGIGSTKNIDSVKWDLIVNQPEDHQLEEFNSNPNNRNGQWKFEPILLKLKVDLVIDIRDVFAYSYQTVSPFRDMFNHIGIAAVDGIPQKKHWLEIFRGLDGVFVYTDWAKQVLEKEGIKVDGLASPSITDNFCELKTNIKEEMGLGDFRIIGSVMRNQPRKLIPELFEGFRKYLDNSGDDKTLLYLHCSYPDVAFDIPELLLTHGLSSKVLFTFYCEECNSVFPSFWRGTISHCPYCGEKTAKTAEITDDINDETLNEIYSIFDYYIQLANREGFGQPQLEAIKCGKPVATVNYSGMKHFIDNYDCLPIEPDVIKFSYKMEMYEACVNVDNVAKSIEELLKRDNKKVVQENWKSSFQTMLDFIDQKDFKGRWNLPYDIKPIPEYQEFDCSNYDYARYLVLDVLQKPKLISSMFFTRLVDELNYGFSFGRQHGIYLLEPEYKRSSSIIPFNRKVAYNFLRQERERINFWENQRKIQG